MVLGKYCSLTQNMIDDSLQSLSTSSCNVCVAEAKSKATIIGPGSTPLFWKLCAWKSLHILKTYLQVLHFSCIIAETPGPFSYWVTRSDQPTTTMADVRLCSLCLTIFILNTIKSTHIGRWTSVYLLTSPPSFLCFRVSFTWESLCLSGHIKVPIVKIGCYQLSTGVKTLLPGLNVTSNYWWVNRLWFYTSMSRSGSRIF